MDLTFRTNVSLPDEMKKRIDTYNKNYPGTPINLSRVTQNAVEEILKKGKI